MIGIPTYLIVIDNVRYDQWKIIEPTIVQDFNLVKDEMYYSIYQLQHNILEIPFLLDCYHLKLRKDFLINGRMMKMKEEKICLRKISLLINYKELGKRDSKHSYTKITNIDFGRKVINRIPNMNSNDINVIVYNFVDMLSLIERI